MPARKNKPGKYGAVISMSTPVESPRDLTNHPARSLILRLHQEWNREKRSFVTIDDRWEEERRTLERKDLIFRVQGRPDLYELSPKLKTWLQTAII